MRGKWIRAALAALAMTTIVACGDDDGADAVDAGRDSGMGDAGGGDASMADGGTMMDAAMADDAATDMDGGGDGATGDASSDDASADDAAMDDAAMDDAAMDDAGLDGGGPTASAQIMAVRAAPAGAVDLPVDGAIVTYVQSYAGGATTTDPVGFFVQGAMAGPALFVAVDPMTLDPVPAVGDTVSFDVTMTAVSFGHRRATAITGWMRNASGGAAAATPLVQDASATNFALSAMVDAYDSELITLGATIIGDVRTCGEGYSCFQFTSAGVMMASDAARIRLAGPVQGARGLRDGCEIELGPTPMWRFNTNAQPAAWVAGDLRVVMCPNPTVDSAVAADAMNVIVTFDAPLDPATVVPEAFTITGGPAGVAVTVTTVDETTPSVVTLTTDVGLAEGVTYTVTVATSVEDPNGIPVAGDGNTATFEFVAPCEDLVINEVQVAGSGGSAHEFVEIYNGCARDVSLAGYALVYRSSAGTTDIDLVSPIGDITVPAGEYVIFTGQGFPSDPPLSSGSFGNAMGALGGGGGGVALRPPGSTTEVVDSVGYGGATNAFIETTRAPGLMSGQSIARMPNGRDTDNNSMDFGVSTTPTPGAANPDPPTP